MKNFCPNVYLDYAAATPVLLEVAAGHAALCRDYFFNPHAGNCFSENCRRAIDAAGVRLLELLGIAPDGAEVVWTGGGTEADNLGCLGVLRAGSGTAAAAVESSAHSALLEPCLQWAVAGGACRKVPVARNGQLEFAGTSALNPAELKLLALCHVNNETGVIQDLESVGRELRALAPEAILIVDAAQSFAKLPVPWAAAGIDLLAVTGHKIGGPPNVGALIRRKGVKLQPLMFGGGQQRGLRPGTLDTVGILEFVAAAEIMTARRQQHYQQVLALNRRLRELLQSEIAADFIFVSPPDASPYILNFCFTERFEGAVIMRALAERGVVIATGSACSAESATVSHVLKAMGIPRFQARGALRVSFGIDSCKKDVEIFVRELDSVLREY